MEKVSGNHPYADKFPMASEEELEELTASVAQVGLIHPVVLTPDGLVLDGRNRLEACRRAGVDPHFETREGDDDEYKEFVIGVNTTGRRESMTVQIAAASAALILGHDRRKNGRWVGWSNSTLQNSVKSRAESEAMRTAGLVIDELGPPHLESVRDGDLTLNAAYEQAKQIKHERETAEQRRVEQARQEEEREQYAAEYFDSHPDATEWLNSKPEGVFASMRAAFAAYQEEDAKARAAEEQRRREEEQRQREYDASLKRDADRIRSFLNGYSCAYHMSDHPHRKDVLAKLDDFDREQFIQIEGEITWPATKP